MELRTPLYDCHIASGGKMTPFAGYLLPVEYPTGILAEHNAVRTAAGLFDVSHMGEILVAGGDSPEFLNRLFTADISGMSDNTVRYSLLCNPDGGVIDDVLVYRFCSDHHLLVVNAANRQKDYEWLESQMSGSVALRDMSDELALIAIQGPAARDIVLALDYELLTPISPESPLPEKYYHFIEGVYILGVRTLVSRTGYTGEAGYEIYTDPEIAPKIWNRLLKVGKPYGLIPCGLGARDTLRLEAGMPLYGHEMDETISPLDTALGFAVKMDKPDFVGKQGIIARGEPVIKRVGLKITGKGIARENQDVYQQGVRIGRTTSGTFSPFLKYPIAMALVDVNADTDDGDEVEIDIRGRRVAAQVVPLPFYKNTNK